MIEETSYSHFFLPDEDFGSEDDDLGADDGKADSDYESSQKSKKGKKAKPDKNKRASKSRKRPAGEEMITMIILIFQESNYDKYSIQ